MEYIESLWTRMRGIKCKRAVMNFVKRLYLYYIFSLSALRKDMLRDFNTIKTNEYILITFVSTYSSVAVEN